MCSQSLTHCLSPLTKLVWTCVNLDQFDNYLSLQTSTICTQKNKHVTECKSCHYAKKYISSIFWYIKVYVQNVWSGLCDSNMWWWLGTFSLFHQTGTFPENVSDLQSSFLSVLWCFSISHFSTIEPNPTNDAAMVRLYCGNTLWKAIRLTIVLAFFFFLITF